MWHCDIANVKKIDYGTLTPSLLSLSLVGKLWFCDAHKFQGPIPGTPQIGHQVCVGVSMQELLKSYFGFCIIDLDF